MLTGGNLPLLPCQLTIFENNDKKYDNRHEKPKSVFDFLKTIERAHREPLATGQS